MQNLYPIWQSHCAQYTGDEQQVQSYWQEIYTAYNSKSRHYHNLKHLQDLLRQADQYQAQLQDYSTLCFSIFYHDIVYKSLRKDNEVKSGELAQARLQHLHLPTEHIKKSVQQIGATQHHQIPAGNTDPDLPWFLDFDLSILGSPWERYYQYTLAIRREYRIYPAWMYRNGRRKALQRFLDRPRLFFTDEYLERYETKARKNIKRELRLE